MKWSPYRLVQQSLLSDPVPNQKIVGNRSSHERATAENISELHDVPF